MGQKAPTQERRNAKRKRARESTRARARAESAENENNGERVWVGVVVRLPGCLVAWLVLEIVRESSAI